MDQGKKTYEFLRHVKARLGRRHREYRLVSHIELASSSIDALVGSEEGIRSRSVTLVQLSKRLLLIIKDSTKVQTQIVSEIHVVGINVGVISEARHVSGEWQWQTTDGMGIW